jgi:hypothetical protein
VALAAGLSACGGSDKTTATHASKGSRPAATRAQAPQPPLPRHLTATVATTLPAPVMDPATTSFAGRALLVGGLDQSDVSVPDVIVAGPGGARRIATLPAALHDAAAATLGGSAYVIGGGEPSHDEITRVAPGTNPVLAGRLPEAASDVSAATIGDTVYIVGGYTGTVPLRTIVAWNGTGAPRIVGTLPYPVRYAAVAAVGDRLIITGGTSGTEAMRDVLTFDPASRQVSRLARLSAPLTHAAAATLGGIVYVIGGRGTDFGTQVPQILAIDPARHRVSTAGALPLALSDTGAAAVPAGILVAGGRQASGTLSDHVYLLRAASR